MSSYFRQVGNNRLKHGNFLKNNGAVPLLIANTFWAVTPGGQRHITFSVKDSYNNLLANTNVSVGIFEYKQGNPFNYQWMQPIESGIYTTSASGVIDMLYTGTEQVGGQCYVALFKPNSSPTESFIWPQTITFA